MKQIDMADKYKKLKRQLRKVRAQKKMCLDKKQFETEDAAYQKGQKCYQCKHCGKWHRSGQMARFINKLTTKTP